MNRQRNGRSSTRCRVLSLMVTAGLALIGGARALPRRQCQAAVHGLVCAQAEWSARRQLRQQTRELSGCEAHRLRVPVLTVE